MHVWIALIGLLIAYQGHASAASVSGGGGGGGAAQGLDANFDLTGGNVITGTSEARPLDIKGTGGQSNSGIRIYQHSNGEMVITCLVNGVENACDKAVKLAAGKSWFVTNAGSSHILQVDENTGKVSVITLNTEDAGVSLTMKDYKYYPFAGCNAGTPAPIWELPAANAPTAACKGTNYAKGVLEFADGATDLSALIHDYLVEDWTGNIDATIIWESASTSTNNVLWGIAIACAGPGDNSDPAFTDDDFTADANNGTANTYNATAVNTVTTTGSCAAGDVMHIRVKRRLSQAGDTLAATAQGVGLALKLRQAQ